MKKFILAAAALIGFSAMQAQVTVEGSKFSDNWSLGLKGIAWTPLHNDGFFDATRAGVGIEIGKQVTPVLGFSLEGNFYINPNQNGWAPGTIFDAHNVSLLGRLNLMNMFAGYKGAPRLFEMEAVLGAGWMHMYGTKGATDDNAFSTKAGLNFNFNLGEAKAWTVSLKPAVVWNMEYNQMNGEANYDQYNSHGAFLEVAAGVTYHFKNSNGTHSFKIAELRNQSEIDALNSKINGLRGDLNNKDNELNAANARVNQLQNDLNRCKDELGKKPTVVTNNKETMDHVITFAQGKSVIAASQLPNVERVANYLKKHKDSKVDIKGYASPEGSAEINEKIANARAEAVKTILVKKYKINADRINAKGQGVGNMFSEADWNRVSICTLDDAK